MKVNFYATFRQIVGGKTVDISIPAGSTISELIEAIVERFPAMRSELLNQDGELYGHVHVIVNGRNVPFLEDTQETVLSIDDSLDIFPAVGGGAETSVGLKITCDM